MTRLTCVACLVTIFGLSPGMASAGSPRWYGKATGALVPFNGRSGLTEVTSAEPLQETGQLKVLTGKTSSCLAKGREVVTNPSGAEAPGTGATEEFQLACEEGTGAINEAAPYPCLKQEGFEVLGVGLNWPSSLEVGKSRHENKPNQKGYPIRDLPHYYDHIIQVALEVHCLKSGAHDEYKGSLRPEVEVGRLSFPGDPDELTDTSGHQFSLKGNDFLSPAKFKDIRVNSLYREISMPSLVQEP
jgi:hypothetical protein